MDILLSLLLAQARILPEIDRRALDLQARAEALQPRRAPAAKPAKPAATATVTTRRPPTVPTSTRTAARPGVSQRPPATAAKPAVRPATIRRAAGGALDLTAITTICRAAGNQADPATFIARLTKAYSLNASEGSALRTSCAAYLAGRADARTGDYDTPGQ